MYGDGGSKTSSPASSVTRWLQLCIIIVLPKKPMSARPGKTSLPSRSRVLASMCVPTQMIALTFFRTRSVNSSSAARRSSTGGVMASRPTS